MGNESEKVEEDERPFTKSCVRKISVIMKMGVQSPKFHQ